jgi:hypothetical protein
MRGARRPLLPDQTQNGRGEIAATLTEAQWSDVIQRARRIWDAIRLHKQATSGIHVPVWEEMDSVERETMISLAAESLGLKSPQ